MPQWLAKLWDDVSDPKSGGDTTQSKKELEDEIIDAVSRQKFKPQGAISPMSRHVYQ